MNIADFAKDLLFEMKFGKGTDSEDLEIGKVRRQYSLGVESAKVARPQ